MASLFRSSLRIYAILIVLLVIGATASKHKGKLQNKTIGQHSQKDADILGGSKAVLKNHKKNHVEHSPEEESNKVKGNGGNPALPSPSSSSTHTDVEGVTSLGARNGPGQGITQTDFNEVRPRRSIPVSDYGAGTDTGNADVVVDLLAEVSGLEAMVKELVSALQQNMAGVGTEFAKVQTQVVDLQRRFDSAFTMLNGTVQHMYSQMATEVSTLRADVYRIHAALQGSTPTGQRLIVQPDRPDPTIPKAIGVDCASLYRAGARESGVYMLQPDPSDNATKMAAFCDMATAGGGWTVIQRRVDGSEDFYRSWRSYKLGFGSLLHDFWLGLDNIHRLTKFGNTHLRVELHDWENKTRVGEYRYVRVMNESDAYRILAGSASGDAGDPFHSVAYTSRLQSMRFSTFDVDNDLNTRGNCAQTFTSGWWFNSCFSVNLNGVWYGSASYIGPSMNGIVWDLWDHRTNGYSLQSAEMKLRTENF